MGGENNDSFTEVTSQGLGSRLMESIKGVLVGLVMFIAAFPVLWMNEGCSVKTAADLGEGEKKVISIKADKVDAANNGKLVHMSGQAVTDETLTDGTMGVSQKGIKLIRKVEMFQWVETKTEKKEKKMGGREETVTTYDYKTEWRAEPVNSNNFKRPAGHNNPPMAYKSETKTATLVKLGAFRLSQALIGQITGGEALPMQQENLAKLPADIKTKAQISGGEIYVGNPTATKVGDLKIGYTVVKPQMISILSKQINDTFETFIGEKGTSIDRVEAGEKSAQVMFQKMKDENVMRTWILRLVGFLLMFIGITMIFKPISTLGDVVPIVGSILSMGLGLVAFVIALPLTLLTIAIAWIAARPILGIALLAVAAVVFGAIWFIAKQKKAKAATAA